MYGQPASLLPLKDEAHLSLYFGTGLARFERSVSGQALERHGLYAYDSEPCPRCSDYEDGVTASSEGSGIVDGKPCPICCRVSKPGYAGRPGVISRLRSTSAVRPPLTACMTGSSIAVGAPEHPDLGVILLVAGVSRRLLRLTRTQAAVLEAYYGDRGHAWASAQPCTVCYGTGYRNRDAGHQCPICKGAGHIERVKVGRVFAVYVLTKWARKILADESPEGKPDEQLFSLWLASQHGMGKVPAAHWQGIDIEARRLIVEACVAWRKLDG